MYRCRQCGGAVPPKTPRMTVLKTRTVKKYPMAPESQDTRTEIESEIWVCEKCLALHNKAVSK